MIAVRSFPDGLSTSPILRPKRWEWLEAVLQRSNLTSSNSWRKREATIERPLMGWSGRAPAPPASEAGKGRQRQGARHVSDTQYRDRRDRHRYRQELVPRRGPRCARRHRAAAKVVAWPSGSAARQYTALPDRHGSLRRRTCAGDFLRS